jgi:sigma-E factor negative regulatory protein RseB
MMRARNALLPALAFGAAAGVQAAPPDDPLAWLQRAANASRSSSYSGTFVHTNGERTSTVRIAHAIVDGVEQERVEPLEGQPHEIVRRGEDMICYMPEQKTMRLDKRVSARFFPSIFRGPPEALTESYTLKLGNQERMLGLDCQWIRLDPKDGLRFAQRLCVEVSTGLLLRARTLNERKQVIEQWTFTDLKMGSQVARSELKPTLQSRVKSWTTDAVPRDEAKGTDTGWEVTNLPAGYRKIGEMRRSMPGRPAPVSQIVLSDGLATISVFVEPAGMPARPAEAASEEGTTSFFVRPAGDNVVTVLGEVPIAAAQQVGRSVSRRP